MTCVRCDQPDDDAHHVTGRGADGRYLGPEFTARTCHSCHELVHDDWHTLDVVEGTAANTQLEILELGLTRTAAFVGRLADALPEPICGFMARLAAWLARCAAGLAAAIYAFDNHVPEWRTSPDV